MDSKVNAATWALDRGVSVVICNGTQDKAIKTIIAGRKVGTFFTETAAGGPTPVDMLAENGKAKCNFLFLLFSFLTLFFFNTYFILMWPKVYAIYKTHQHNENQDVHSIINLWNSIDIWFALIT